MGIEVLRGVCIGYGAAQYKQAEDSALVGVNRFLTVAAQAASVANAVYIAQLALQTTSLAAYGHFSLGVRVVLYLTPVITNIACAKLKMGDHPLLKRSLIILNTHIGSVCQVAVAVSAVTLIVFGQPLLGGVSLAFIIAGFVQRRCWLPLAISNGINMCGFVGINTARLVLGESLLSQAAAICEIANFVYAKIARLRGPAAEPAAAEATSLPINQAPDSLWLRVDQRHLVKGASLPPSPEVNLQTLKTNYSRFNLQDPVYLNRLKQMVRADEHWQEFFADKGSDAELIAYVHTGLDRFVENVSNRTIRSGEINDYRSLQSRAKHIAHQLPSKSDEDQFINTIRLALASYYCPAGYLEKVRAVYYTVCDSFSDDSLGSRLDQVLDQSRRYLFQVFLHDLWANNPMRHLTDPEDNHIYNEFVNLLGESFHLSEVEDAEQDALSYIDVLTKKMWMLLYRPLIKPFIEAYDTSYIITNTEEALANGQLPYDLMDRWFIDEYVQVLRSKCIQQVNESERDYNQRLIDEATGWVHDHIYDIMTGKVEERYIGYFLTKMKVLKVDDRYFAQEA
ncbi:hypothetical protein [Candidatus Protochlamydia phocaeensis]|uniref:hypothetical protein n=1 Tax=Candidatus Protochlamydia phocaeensis TaxID=1414722 RepID=UPI000839668C|nr:hypothetical protein [Candidatus Protochlamydia phocaeensis]